MKANELTDSLLDYWAARAGGMSHEQASFVVPAHAYSTDWAYGGPIIEREKISIERRGFGDEEWYAYFGPHDKAGLNWYGPAHYGRTPLIAAMRAFVHIKFGEDVPEAA